MDDPSKNLELIERFGEQPLEIMGEFHSMLKLYDIDVQELFFKWESYSMKMGPDDTKLALDTVRAFKKDVQDQLEREVRGKTRMQQQTPAVQRTIRPQAGADSFALLDGLLPTTPGRQSAIKRKNTALETPRAKSSRMLDASSPAGVPVSSPLQVKTPFRPSDNALPRPAFESITPFSNRVNANETIEVLNPHIPIPLLPLTDASYESRINFLFNMEIKNFSYRPMYQKLTEASEIQDERIDEFSAAIQEHYNIPEESFGDPSIASPTEIVAVGRIVSDSLQGRLNPSSILLESSRMTGAGARTPLKVDKISSFAFFPGQIVAVKGVNSSGSYFQVHQVMEPPKLPPACTPVNVLRETAERLSAGPVTIFVAAGPYTTDDNLNFEALDELCSKAAAKKPDAVILTGPFIDSEHPLVQIGDFDLEGVDGKNKGTIEDLFRERISPKIHRIKDSMVIIIPSLRDAVSKHLSFPQESLKRKPLDLPLNVRCLPNPSMLSFNEIVISITTNDILFHLSKEEVVRSPTLRNPSARFASHLLTQRSFYPLFPPPERSTLPQSLSGVGAALDVPHSRLFDLVNVSPDVLLVPSMLGAFAKVVDGVLVVNPGSASRRLGTGTWVEMVVQVPNLNGIRVDEVGMRVHDVWERSRVEVKRI